MMKQDEKEFLLAIYKLDRNVGQRPRDLIHSPESKMNYKRAWYILEKWTDNRDWYEYGVNLELGWLTEAGKRKAEELLLEVGLTQPNPWRDALIAGFVIAKEKEVLNDREP